jgi:hypothetical protein
VTENEKKLLVLIFLTEISKTDPEEQMILEKLDWEINTLKETETLLKEAGCIIYVRSYMFVTQLGHGKIFDIFLKHLFCNCFK